MEVFYNRARRHSALGYLSPVGYEKPHKPLTRRQPFVGKSIQRFLARFLFVGAAFFGIGTFVSAAKAVSSDMRAVGMLVGSGIPAWMLAWLGMALWSGRGIPRWFIASFLMLTVFGRSLWLALQDVGGVIDLDYLGYPDRVLGSAYPSQRREEAGQAKDV